MQEEYEKKGYLYDEFKMFHVLDQNMKEIPYHYHDFYKILIFIKGNVNYLIEGKNYKLRPFDIVMVNRESIHKPEIHTNEIYERIIFYISESYFEKYKDIDVDLRYCFQKAKDEGSSVIRFPALKNAKIQDIIKNIEMNGDENNLFASKFMAEILFTEFMILLNRGCFDKTGSFNYNIAYNQKMIDIIQYINEHLTEELSIDKLAENFYISKFYMMRQFKEETGYTIHQYIKEKRILLGKKLILSGMQATEACFECGFKDYSTFSRAFKKQLDTSPTGREGEE